MIEFIINEKVSNFCYKLTGKNENLKAKLIVHFKHMSHYKWKSYKPN